MDPRIYARSWYRAAVAVLLFAVAGLSVGATPTWVKLETTGTGTSTWKKVCIADGPPGTWRKVQACGGAPAINCTISASTQNYNIFSQCAASPTTPVAVTLTVSANVYVWSDNAAQPAMDSGALPAGSSLTLINYGYIIGKGGDGSGSTTTPNVWTAAGNGGTALNLTVNATIDTTGGYIAGGGGGGGTCGYGGAVVAQEAVMVGRLTQVALPTHRGTWGMVAQLGSQATRPRIVAT